MKTIVQLESFPSFFNESLQKYLMKNGEFSEKCRLVVLNLEDQQRNYKQDCKITYDISSFLPNIRYWIGFNQYLNWKYKDLFGNIANIQSVIWQYIFLLPFLRKHFQKTVLSFWGSDILRVSRRVLHMEKRLFDHADVITFISDDMKEKIKEAFGKKYDEKLRKIDFGSEILDCIDALSDEDVRGFKQNNGIPEGKKCLVIGYNRNKSQQHTAILQSMIDSGLNTEDVAVIFPWTYGTDDPEYRDQIEQLVKGKYEYVFLQDKLSTEEVACLRRISDLMVQTQTTDALSSSMLETIYAEKDVITGSWLHYDELNQAGVQLHYVDSLDDVGSTIREVLMNPFSDQTKEHNKEIIREMCGWETRIRDWLDLYL